MGAFFSIKLNQEPERSVVWGAQIEVRDKVGTAERFFDCVSFWIENVC